MRSLSFKWSWMRLQCNILQLTFKVNKFFLSEHAIHGLVYDAAFEPVHEQADETGAMLQLEYCYAATDKGFPFRSPKTVSV